MGWAIALTLTLLATGVVAFALPTRARAKPAEVPWDVPRVAQTFTPIVGALAGFSVASTIFIANLTTTREAPGFPSLLGMFVIAFVVFVATAQEFGMTPNLPTGSPGTGGDYVHLQRLSYLLAMYGYFIALTVSWTGLEVLLRTLGLQSIADVFRWVLLFVIVAGATRLAMQHLYALTTLPRSTCLAIPAIGFTAAAVFRHILVPSFPALAPLANEPFLIAVACFAIAALGFLFQSAILAFHDWPAFNAFIERTCDRVLMALLGMVSAVVGILWVVVAFS